MSEPENDENPFESKTRRVEDPPIIHHSDDGSDRSVTSKESSRKNLDSDVRKFLSKGGAVTQIDPRVTADPPKRPVSNYVSRPI